MTKKLNHIFFLLGIFVLTSCSLSKSLPEGAYLYGGAKVKIKKAEKDAEEEILKPIYKEIIRKPEPNGKLLGVRWKLRFYNLFYTQKEKGLKQWLQRKLGEPPVIYKETVTDQVENLLKNKAFNNGFFDATPAAEVKKKRRVAKVKYSVTINKTYRIDSFFNKVEVPEIRRIIAGSNRKSLVKIGEPFNLSTLKIERERLMAVLRQNGYYYFRDDFLKFKADTTKAGDEIHLQLMLKDNIDSTDLKRQRIGQIKIISDYTEPDVKIPPRDTILFEGLRLIYRKYGVRPEVLRKAIAFSEGEIYATDKHARSIKQLSQISIFQFANIRFEPSQRSDTVLNVIVLLTPRKRESVEGSIGMALKQGLYFGPEISLSYVNRNIFRGAEEFRLTAFGNYNFPLQSNIASQQETGVSASLTKPGLLVPFGKSDWLAKRAGSRNLIGKTRAALTYKNQRVSFPIAGVKDFLIQNDFPELAEQLETDSTFTPYVGFGNYDFSWTYNWRNRPDKQFELTPLNLIFQTPRFQIPELQPFLLLKALEQESIGQLFNLEPMLVIKPAYTFLYDSRLKKIQTQNLYYRGKVSVSGNFVLSKDPLLPREFLESRIFQIENDFRYFWNPSPRNTVAFRTGTNILFPLGTRILIPFFERYTIGGPNSVRAFNPRLVGPGTVEPVEESLIFAGTGDILFEMSLEWRPQITDLLELGIFVDAGNVWNYNAGFTANPAGAFDINEFYKELAIGTGIGLRLDFDILVLRADFAFPLTKPWLPEGERWIGDKIQPLRGDWLTENVSFNLAFGYPF